jgi:hypothetical protein
MKSAESETRKLEASAAICTLFEGNYHFGLAAFVNSLVGAGFKGTVWIGYRGALPPWLDQVNRCDGADGEYMVTDDVRMAFLPLSTPLHLTNYKPTFMLDLLAGPARECAYLWYFDPDIWLASKWAFYAGWQRHGVALCQEITNNILPDDSPLRYQWMEIAETISLKNPRPLQHYYNGGLVGVPAEHTDFLRLWKRLIELSAEHGCALDRMMPGTRDMPFHASDQDALNMTAMYAKAPLTTLGPEGMGFIPGGARMYHTVGTKPWKGSFLKRALHGNPPTSAMKAFFPHCEGPIRPYTPWQLQAKRLACTIAAMIGRFYGRR